jgi:PIN domain nuclease of toxin-antitoxin system
MPEKQRLLLDTHVWIWLLEKTGNLSDTTINKINEAAKERQVLIAAISLWEVSLLEKKKRIIFKDNVLTWLNKALLHPGVMLCPLIPTVAAEAYALPGTFHGDPADRIIVATARLENAVLITRDAGILRYGKAGHVKVLLA